MLQSVLLAALLASSCFVHAAFELGIGDDDDLTNFVTRPEIKAPRFNVTVYESGSLAPGYWFIAPYAKLAQEYFPSKYYQPCQTGPAIYDTSGELIWSGACAFRNNNTCDFRVYRNGDEDALSAVFCAYSHGPIRHGIVLDASYNAIQNITAPQETPDFNMHELNIIDNGKSALHFMDRSEYVDVSELGIDGVKQGWILDTGFREMDLKTGKTTFEWWASKHVAVSESSVKVERLENPYPLSWNWFHGNSINKNSGGDYLVSSRFTDCIYKISGKNGEILWRFGGQRSTFKLDGFNFSRQHDAQWVSHNDNTEVVSFLDNASDMDDETSSYSSALIVELDKISKTARVVQRIERPDHQLSRLRGNFQHLPNGNLLVGWSDNSYISEHAADGRLLTEAHFTTDRFFTYRSYKFEFAGKPTEPPVLKAFAFGSSSAKATTVCYVSWNGATEVSFWRFFSMDPISQRPVLRGEIRRSGFETSFHDDGYQEMIYVEAIDSVGSVLAKSEVFEVQRPRHWTNVHSSSGGSLVDVVIRTLPLCRYMCAGAQLLRSAV
ncbi:hypothetical protein M409DRAFT_62296 [Zasmidium cellare ATCC 36951]|uniref:ASST-domain-containing protein n=1 Tax=Zasmidium cellare ATCC 36951 TaxID=1080233 RepID=A0A6A6D4W9_ZASCE|nr:uncharacterized protein M409DRAFT_62296 [Zasmidium cellare ATCC 36951]KAF2174173.1 hypothetical protein M409DRAFT_62296 [Zasmidium cellare ATCC 36951]